MLTNRVNQVFPKNDDKSRQDPRVIRTRYFILVVQLFSHESTHTHERFHKGLDSIESYRVRRRVAVTARLATSS